MADAFLLKDLLDGDHKSGLQHVAEFVVDARSEGLHGRGERHVGIDEWRNVVAE